MMSSIGSISSSPSATVRVEKATSEFLIGPDWTMNIDICDTINSNQMLGKDVVKAVKKRLQHKSPKVQLLALTLLETMVKNCGDYVHFQIAEGNILQEMVKIVKKKTDMHVRDKILILIGAWHDAFGRSGGRYPQYHMAYEDLRRFGIAFPPRSPDASPIFTPPVTHPVPIRPQPGYGMPSSSSTRLDEAMATEESLSLSIINSMREVLDLLIDMLGAIDPSDSVAVQDEVIVDLVEQCRANQRKLMQMLTTTGDEELLGRGVELNDSLQSTLAKHDAIVSGSPLPPQVINVKPEASVKPNASPQPVEAVAPDTALGSTPSASVLPLPKDLSTKKEEDEEEEEEDEFAMLVRRHSKVRNDTSNSMSKLSGEELTLAKTTESSEDALSSVVSTALVPITTADPVRTKDQDIIDLLSITLSTATSTEQTPQSNSSVHSMLHAQIPLDSPASTHSSEAGGMTSNSYAAPWAQSQSQPQPLFRSQIQPEFQSQQDVHSPPTQRPHQQSPPGLQPLPPPQPQFPELSSTGYPPPPWASTPGYFSNPNPVHRPTSSFLTMRPASSPMLRPSQQESNNGNTLVNSSPQAATPNPGQKPFIPSYRLFEDLNVFGNTDRVSKATSQSSQSASGSNFQNMVGGSK